MATTNVASTPYDKLKSLFKLPTTPTVAQAAQIAAVEAARTAAAQVQPRQSKAKVIVEQSGSDESKKNSIDSRPHASSTSTTPPHNTEDFEHRRRHHQRQLDLILARPPVQPQLTLSPATMPYRRFRGVTWVKPGEDLWTCNIYLLPFDSATEVLFLRSLPCFLLVRRSTWLKAVLDQQPYSAETPVARVVLMVDSEGRRKEAQVKALREIFACLMLPPLDGTWGLERLRVEEGIGEDVRREIGRWCGLLGVGRVGRWRWGVGLRCQDVGMKAWMEI